MVFHKVLHTKVVSTLAISLRKEDCEVMSYLETIALDWFIEINHRFNGIFRLYYQLIFIVIGGSSNHAKWMQSTRIKATFQNYKCRMDNHYSYNT